jgi:hypothetical protein
MSLVKSLRRLFSGGGKAAALYERGMVKAKRDDWSGAVADYTAAIDAANVPRDVKAMALFNRALAYAHLGNQERADEDLHATIGMPDAPIQIKTSAKAKLARWGKRRTKAT